MARIRKVIYLQGILSKSDNFPADLSKPRIGISQRPAAQTRNIVLPAVICILPLQKILIRVILAMSQWGRGTI